MGTMARPRKEETEPLQLRVPIEIKKELRIEAATNGTTMSQIFLDAYALYKKKKQSQQK